MTVKSKRHAIQARLIELDQQGILPKADDIALEFDVSRAYVATIRGTLARRGAIRRSPRGRGDRAPRTVSEQESIYRLREQKQKNLAAREAKRAILGATRPLEARLRELASPITSYDADMRSIVERVLSGEAVPMTLDQRRALLTELALKTNREEIKVSCANALERIDARVGTDLISGPSDPQSVQDWDRRLDRLLKLREERILYETRSAQWRSDPTEVAP